MPKPRTRGRIYIGVDPGKSGGLVALVDREVVHAVKMPPTEMDVLDWFQLWDLSCREVVAVLEKVWGHIGKEQPGSAMFNFGQGYGGLRMAMLAVQIPFEEVTPNKWQRGLGISPRKKTEGRTQWKNRLKARAQQLFPEVKVTLAIADALLIAEYCRRTHTRGGE